MGVSGERGTSVEGCDRSFLREGMCRGCILGYGRFWAPESGERGTYAEGCDRPFPEGRDVSWVDMGWRLEHVTAGTTASSTKCKGTSQLAVGSTQGEEVKEELINLHLLEEKASGL